MRKLVVIRVGKTHHGELLPGMMVAVFSEDIGVWHEKTVHFKNPYGGYSAGEVVATMELTA
jgi:hypothetical protein